MLSVSDELIFLLLVAVALACLRLCIPGAQDQKMLRVARAFSKKAFARWRKT